MAKRDFQFMQSTIIDKQSKAKEEYTPLQVKLPAEFEKDVPVRAFMGWTASSSVMRASMLSTCVSSMQGPSRKNPAEDACLAGLEARSCGVS